MNDVILYLNKNEITLEYIDNLLDQSYWLKQRLYDKVIDLLTKNYLSKHDLQELSRTRSALERSKVRMQRRVIILGIFRGYDTQADMDLFIERQYGKKG